MGLSFNFIKKSYLRGYFNIGKKSLAPSHPSTINGELVIDMLLVTRVWTKYIY